MSRATPCRDIALDDTRHAVRWMSADGQSAIELDGPAGQSIRDLLGQCGTFQQRIDILEGALVLDGAA